MSALPKLTAEERARIQRMEHQRRRLVRLIAALQDKLREFPEKKQLAADRGVSYKVIRRVLYGDPYRTRHPQDERDRAA